MNLVKTPDALVDNPNFPVEKPPAVIPTYRIILDQKSFGINEYLVLETRDLKSFENFVQHADMSLFAWTQSTDEESVTVKGKRDLGKRANIRNFYLMLAKNMAGDFCLRGGHDKTMYPIKNFTLIKHEINRVPVKVTGAFTPEVKQSLDGYFKDYYVAALLHESANDEYFYNIPNLCADPKIMGLRGEECFNINVSTERLPGKGSLIRHSNNLITLNYIVALHVLKNTGPCRLILVVNADYQFFLVASTHLKPLERRD